MNKLSFIQTSYKGSSFDEFAIDGRPLSTIIETQDGYCPISRKQSWADSDSNDYLKCLMLKMKSSLSSGRPILEAELSSVKLILKSESRGQNSGDSVLNYFELSICPPSSMIIAKRKPSAIQSITEGS